MSTFILLHGAWHGAWCWEKIIPLLKLQGHQVIAPDLPGHGGDHTLRNTITLDTYIQAVSKIIDSQAEPVILVGHSMAGIILSGVGELHAAKIQKMVYVSAFMLESGESLLSVMKLQKPTRFSNSLLIDQAANAITISMDTLKMCAYHQSSQQAFADLQARFCVEPLAPWNTPVITTADQFGSILKVYIECRYDRTLPIATQRSFYQSIPCKLISLDSDHTPFYSDPAGLAHALLCSV
jgi:pimeloyl-ACP methyl ester carboxylesterase